MIEDKLDAIAGALKEKAVLKQRIYRQTLGVFDNLKKIAESQADMLADVFKKVDPTVVIEFEDNRQFDFRLKFSGDLLMFTMHSNVVTFPPENVIFQSPYVQEDDSRAFFGHIMVYNFMADSIKYNRLDDPGYLLARIMINHEGHFFIEGVRPLGFLFPDIAQNIISDEILKLFIQQNMLVAIDSDLQAPPIQSIQVIPLGYTLQNEMVGAGEKVGFKMSTDPT